MADILIQTTVVDAFAHRAGVAQIVRMSNQAVSSFPSLISLSLFVITERF